VYSITNIKHGKKKALICEFKEIKTSVLLRICERRPHFVQAVLYSNILAQQGSTQAIKSMVFKMVENPLIEGTLQ
jgi:hypothetical protein